MTFPSRCTNCQEGSKPVPSWDYCNDKCGKRNACGTMGNDCPLLLAVCLPECSMVPRPCPPFGDRLKGDV